MNAKFDWNFRYRPAYNVSPGFNLPVVRRDDGSDCQGAVLQCMKWGLIPSFTKKTDKPDHYRMVILTYHPLIIIYTSWFFHIIPNLVLKDSIISCCIMFYYSFNLCLLFFVFSSMLALSLFVKRLLFAGLFLTIGAWWRWKGMRCTIDYTHSSLLSLVKLRLTSLFGSQNLCENTTFSLSSIVKIKT